MIARQESVKVVYGALDTLFARPLAAIVNGGRDPAIYRLTRLSSDEIANLLETGDPDKDPPVVRTGNAGIAADEPRGAGGGGEGSHG